MRHGESSDPAIDAATLAEVVELIWHTEWRARTIEKIEIDREGYARSHRALQSAPLRDFLPITDPQGDSRRIVTLPLQTLPKGPLVNFDIKAPFGQAFLLKRASIAHIEASYIGTLADSIGVAVDSEVFEFIKAICEFTPGPWQSYLDSESSYRSALRRYLTEGLDIKLPDQVFEDWLSASERAGSTLRFALDEGKSLLSSGDVPLLAAPLYASTVRRYSIDTISSAIHSFDQFVSACVLEDGGSSPALEGLADYGRRYEALVQCELDLDSPFTIRVSRDLDLNRKRLGEVEIETLFADASSSHIAVSVADPDVSLRQTGAREPNGEEVQSFTIVRTSREDFAAYGSETQRPYRVCFKFRLLPRFGTLATSIAFIFIAAVSAVLLLTSGQLTTDDAALLVVPSTLIGGFIIVQQRTTLSSQLAAPFRTASLLAIIALWCIVALQMSLGIIETGPN